MSALARRLGCTEGQAYTALIGITVALLAALVGLPPTLRTAGIPAVGSASGQELADAPSPPPNTDTPVAEAPALPPLDTAGGDELAPAGPARSAPPVAPSSSATTAPSSPSSPAGRDPTDVAATGFGSARLFTRVGSPGAPDSVAVDDQGRIHVTTNNGLLRGETAPSKVLRYGADGALDAELVVTGQDPARTGGLTGIASTGDGSVLVLDTAPARLLRVDLDQGSQETVASIPDLPSGGQPQPAALVVDDHGTAYVTDAGQGTIWRIPPGGPPARWHVFADGQAASGPTGIALDAAGDVLVVTAVALQESPAAGLVQRIEVLPDGAAGERTTVAATGPLSGPAGLAVTDGDAVVVTLHLADEVVLLAPDGDERARITAEDVERATGVPLDGPVGVTVHDGAAVVANQSRTDDASSWAVLLVDLV